MKKYKRILLRLALFIWLISFWITVCGLIWPVKAEPLPVIGQTYAEGAYTWMGQSYPEQITDSMEYYIMQAAYLRGQHEENTAPKTKTPERSVATAQNGNESEDIAPPEGVSGTYLGTFRISHYTDAPEENGGYTCTAIGTPIIPGQTVAMKSGYLPYGTKIYIAGVGYRIVEDCGVGSGKIDVAVASKSEAFEKGVFYADVWVMQ